MFDVSLHRIWEDPLDSCFLHAGAQHISSISRASFQSDQEASFILPDIIRRNINPRPHGLYSPTKKLRLFCRILSGAVLTPARMVYISTKLGRSKNTLTMAKYKPIDMVDHYRGKICSHSDTYFQKRGKTLCTGKICKPRNLDKDPYSSAEIAVHNKFSQVIEAIKSLTEEQKAAYKTAFDKQTKYTSLRGYIFAQEYAKLN